MAVTKLTILSRQPFAQGDAFGDVGPYEQIDGRVYFVVDPGHPANTLITDLNLAPRDTSGQVHFSADFRLLRPVDVQRGNRRMLFDVLNRGRALALRNLNSAPNAAPDELLPGNGFLMRQGYTIAWCGWQHDAPDVPGALRLHAPSAAISEGPISGKVVTTFQPNSPTVVEPLGNRGHRPYLTHDIDDQAAVLTEQEHEDAPERIIPRQQWSFARLDDGRVTPDAGHVYKASGFTPGKIYQVIYTSTGAPVVGLGLLATRDMAAFLRYGTSKQGNLCAGNVEHVYGFGVSQSGRFLRTFLYLGLNQDEQERMIFDGVIDHVAGGKRGEFNHRFAQPSSQASRSPNNRFPFSDSDQTDPETGHTDGLLSRLMAQHKMPKIMHTYTSSEYWGGHGALVHIDVTGSRDLEVLAAVRVYHFSGTQHALGPFQLSNRDDGNGLIGQQYFNWTDYRPLLRAALVNLDRWVTSGEAAPASRHPRLDNGTAVLPEHALETLRTLPCVETPNPLRHFARLDFGPDEGVAAHMPPVVGKPYPCLVSAVDADGNEVSGIRLPFQTVPLATYSGWNVRHADIGGAGQILASGGASGGSLVGATIPFPPTPEARQASGDPRPSIAERYASKTDYLEQFKLAAQDLLKKHYVLAEDVDRMMQQAAQHYDSLASGPGK
jgi:hypothetical protein